MYSKKIACLLGSILGFSLVAPMEIQAIQDPIRVAFIEDDGFHTMEVNGGFSGYNYDYLMKLAQYTGWTYEFVVIEDEPHRSAIDVAEEMLQLGEIDLMGSMFLTEENAENFAFGEKITEWHDIFCVDYPPIIKSLQILFSQKKHFLWLSSVEMTH